MHANLRLALVLAIMAAVGCGGSPAANSSGTDVCGGQTVNKQTDPNNCGSCGNVCPAPAHAGAACNQGLCGTGSCDTGWADVDPNAPGCETCVDANLCGSVVLPTTGAVFQVFASGSSYGDQQQRSSNFTNTAVMGESTPPAEDGKVSETSGSFENISGLNAALH